MLKSLLRQSLRERYRPIYRQYRSKWYEISCQFKTETSVLSGKLKRFFFPVSLPKLENREINLHLGCGSINHPKFINIDGLPAPHIHYIRSIDDLSPLKSDSVDLVYACHCLEHFPHAKVPKVLAEWFRVLKEGGILRLSVPDFDLLIDIYKGNENNIDTIITGLMGGQDYKYNFHLTVFNKQSLSSLLKNTGFREIEDWQPGSCELTTFDDHSTCNFLFDGKKYPVSLNLQALK